MIYQWSCCVQTCWREGEDRSAEETVAAGKQAGHADGQVWRGEGARWHDAHCQCWRWVQLVILIRSVNHQQLILIGINKTLPSLPPTHVCSPNQIFRWIILIKLCSQLCCSISQLLCNWRRLYRGALFTCWAVRSPRPLHLSTNIWHQPHLSPSCHLLSSAVILVFKTFSHSLPPLHMLQWTVLLLFSSH